MTILKKFFIFCCSLLVAVCFSWEGKALFGDAHYMIGEKIIERMNKSLTRAERVAFLSGMVYADVGRLKFDELCHVPSDSRDFLLILKDNAVTDQEKWFVKGVEMHILQDEMTAEFMKNSFDSELVSYHAYVMRCGLIDYHFLKKSGRYIYSDFLDAFDFNKIKTLPEVKSLCETLKIPEDSAEATCKFILRCYYTSVNKNTLISCDDLFVRTYRDLGLNITREELHQQQANMLGAFIMVTFISGNKQELNQSLMDRIEDESEKIAAVCVDRLGLIEK